MRTRDHLLEYQYDMGTAGTETFNLDFTDPISEILLLIQATNGASGNKSNPIERNISKIEVVDGGEVLWDLPGDVAFAAYTMLKGGLPDCYRSGALSDGSYVTIPVSFGRHLYDPAYAFNPNGHRNPQLKVTFDEATVRAAGATGFVSDSFALTILVKLMEEATPPVGFLSYRDVYQYTSLASGDTRIELPTDRLIRMLLLRAYESGVGFRSSITNYKLSADGGKFIPFDLPSQYVLDKHGEYFVPVTMPQYTVTNDGETHQTWMGVGYDSQVRAHNAGFIVGASSPASGQMSVYQRTDANVAANALPVHFSVMGHCVHNTLLYPFGRLDAPEDWFDAKRYRQLDLFCTNGNPGAEVNIGVQQVYAY